MPGSLTLLIGSTSASKPFAANNATLVQGLKNAAKGLGYPGNVDTSDIQDVGNWVAEQLATYLKNASKGYRVDGAIDTARASESALSDPFD